jgi:mRNA interferase RelE/StbE
VPKPVILEKKPRKWLHDCRDAELAARVLVKLRAIAAMPDVAGVAKIQGTRDMYRVRVGDYRIVFQWAEDYPLIPVSLIAHRREVYRDL